MFSSFCLLFSSLDLGPVQMALARVFTTSQWIMDVEFPRAPDPPKGRH
jgi:hypothetical protein